MRDNVKDNLKKFGFFKEVDNVEQGLCPFCGEPVSKDDFRDSLSRKEYEISGMCQACQDDVFEED